MPYVLNALPPRFVIVFNTQIASFSHSPPSLSSVMPLVRDVPKWIFPGAVLLWCSVTCVCGGDEHPGYEKGAYLFSSRNLKLYLTGNKVTARTLEHALVAFQIRLAVSGRKKG